MGRAITTGQISAALDKFLQITNGSAWDQVGSNAPLIQVTTHIQPYYEELAGELEDGGPIATWDAGRWFCDGTEAGTVLLATREELKKAGAPFLIWRYMARESRQSGMERRKNVSV
mgnify:CR=1 FL=1